MTADNGDSWHQTGLIDTGISRILDLAPSPDYGHDNTLFMLTWDSAHSLWRSLNGGTSWERILSSIMPDIDQIDGVKLSPLYGKSSKVVYATGRSSGSPAIWKSTDNGDSFAGKITSDPVTYTPFDINTWAVVNDTTLFIGSYDGSNGLVYFTNTSGSSYSTKATVGSQSLNDIAVSPDYSRDNNILVGNTNGWVFLSEDNGRSFQPLPIHASSPPLSGEITVAFDPRFGSNKTVYAASSTPGNGVYRFIIGQSAGWERIDSTLPDKLMIDELYLSAEGALYATSYSTDSGMERCLNPTYWPEPEFEKVSGGLEEGATLSGLWAYGIQLWSIDTTNNHLMTFIDNLAVPVALTSPSDWSTGIGNIDGSVIEGVRLDWEILGGATKYQWQLDYDEDFSAETVLYEKNTTASSVRLPDLEEDTTYYWRVRATEPLLSPWSNTWSFTTSIKTELAIPILESPEDGAKYIEPKPFFQWTEVEDANSYELLVSTDSSFSEPLIAKVSNYALADNSWQSDVGLDYDTKHYWKVRAMYSDNYSAWSNVGVFTTQPFPSNEPDPPPQIASSPETPSSPTPEETIPDWASNLMRLGNALLLTMITVLIVIIVLIVLTVKVFRRQ